MPDLPDFRVVRHCVPTGVDGLSPRQRWLLEDPARVRIFSAPTGAGKSYAFQHAVVHQDKRVLFVVPTRRLAQNLARSIAEDLNRRSGDVGRVAIWTSDERARLRQENPSLDVGRLRLRQVREYELPEGGCIVIATPESVAWLLLRPSSRPHGVMPIDVTDLIRFDHIVFDEFHTIDARGLGLAAVVTRFASALPEAAQVAFLSATPIDVAKPLAAFDTTIQASTGSEEIITGPKEDTGNARAVHGDVSYRFVECESMVEALRSSEDSAKACLTEGKQIVVVYDSLGDLNREKEDLAKWFDHIGVERGQRLAINSIDDSVDSGAGHDTLFDVGRDCDPMSYKALVATSSIEMGVTFRARMMVTDPGHDATSLVQRAGRVARGDENGEVVIRVSRGARETRAWLKTLLHVGGLPIDGSPIEVRRFAGAVLEANHRRFAANDLGGDEPPLIYGSMPQRAVWCAAVFWAALESAGHIGRGQRRTLSSVAPVRAKYVRGRLQVIERSGLDSAQRWVKRFLDEALRLRVILPSVPVKDTTGKTKHVPWNIYASHVDLCSAPAVAHDDGSMVVHLDSRLDEAIRGSDRRKWMMSVNAIFPHKSSVVQLDARDLKKGWLREADAMSRQILDGEQRRVLEAARKLVEMSGIVPSEEEGLPVEGGNNVVF